MAKREACGIQEVQHAESLPEASLAILLLERVRRNAEAILLARHWRVLALVELCCCKAAPEKTAAHVAGWCIPAGDGMTAQKIAIRLRRPKGKGHQLLSFEDVFGTMLHELAHIVHSKHTPAFYRLMDELQAQWEELEASGQVLDERGFPTVGGQRMDSSRHNPSPQKARALALAAAERRRVAPRPTPLGYGHEPSSWRSLPPRERAARAAERRASDATRGFGEEELPEAKRRRLCAMGCRCSEPCLEAEEERLVQLAIEASLNSGVTCISDDEASKRARRCSRN